MESFQHLTAGTWLFWEGKQLLLLLLLLAQKLSHFKVRDYSIKTIIFCITSFIKCWRGDFEYLFLSQNTVMWVVYCFELCLLITISVALRLILKTPSCDSTHLQLVGNQNEWVVSSAGDSLLFIHAWSRYSMQYQYFFCISLLLWSWADIWLKT